jgi:hypothetical protein
MGGDQMLHNFFYYYQNCRAADQIAVFSSAIYGSFDHSWVLKKPAPRSETQLVMF